MKKKLIWGLQPAHWSPNVTVEEAMRAFRKVAAERAAGERKLSSADESDITQVSDDGEDEDTNAEPRELRP